MKPVTMLDLKAEFSQIQDDVRQAIDAVLVSQQFIGGPQVGELEERIGSLLGGAHAVAVSSGTDAILLALMAKGIGSGDEVITTPFTFFATAGCIHRTGARPVFVDIDPATFNLDASKIEAAITKRTKAIVVVHLFGQCADMDEINAVAQRHSLAVIEDAAQAILATDGGRFAGTMSDVGCFSFYPTKNFGGFGEGGMVVTRDAVLAERCRQLRNHGQTDRYHHALVGGNFRLDTMKAAILLTKLPHLDAFTERRRTIAAHYDSNLACVAGLTTPFVRKGCTHCYHQYSIFCDDRDGLRASLQEVGIGTGVYYPVPLHLQPCFAELGYASGDMPVSEATAARIVSLPVHPMVSDEDVVRVVESVKTFYAVEAGKLEGGAPCGHS